MLEGRCLQAVVFGAAGQCWAGWLSFAAAADEVPEQPGLATPGNMGKVSTPASMPRMQHMLGRTNRMGHRRVGHRLLGDADGLHALRGHVGGLLVA